MIVPLLKLLLPLFLLVVLLSRKVNISLSLAVSGISMGLLFGLTPARMASLTGRALLEGETLELFFVIYFVLTLVQVMKAKDSLSLFVGAARELFKSKKVIIVLAPAIIGLLPMPAGALLPAPIVNETLKDDPVSPALKTYINYWFRHIWEYSWPLSSGVIITAAVFHLDLMKVTLINLPFTLLAALIGFLSMKVYLPPLKEVALSKARSSRKRLWLNLFLGVWEVILIILLIMVVHLPPLFAMGGTVLLSWLLLPGKALSKGRLFIKGFQVTLLSSTLVIMVFKAFILNSSVIDLSRELIGKAGSFQILVMMGIPFLIGFLTGISNAYAGITFPLFLSVVGTTSPDLAKVMYLYVSGFLGVLLSPVHFCLILSAQYYRAKLSDVYRLLLPSIIAVALLATVAVILFQGANR